MSRVRAYAQLVRLPNVFTALADIALGVLSVAIVVNQDLASVLNASALALFLASACLYTAGMVWNDFFDVEQDRQERPFRPIPSGRVSRRSAARLGIILLSSGLLCAALAGWTEGRNWTPLVLAAALAAAILLYDDWLKRTRAGPLAMGSCRFLNVLLGVSLGGEAALWTWGLHLAAVVGLYIVGVTWFARTEARTSQRRALAGATAMMLAALLLALPLPLWFSPGVSSPLFPYLLVGLAAILGLPIRSALDRPTPAAVQAAVKRAIFGLVILDAVLATAPAGTMGLVILVLLPPALWLGRWIYST